MKLKQELKGKNNVQIEYRFNLIVGNKILDELFGFCHFVDGELISDDGDDYSLEDEIIEFKWESNNYLVVWISVKTIANEDLTSWRVGRVV